PLPARVKSVRTKVKIMVTISRNPKSRRAFIKDGSLFMLASVIGAEGLAQAEAMPTALQIGIVTDVHYADTDDRGARNYRESLSKMEKAVEALNTRKVQFNIHLGDLIDALPDSIADAPSELRFLKRINTEFSRLKAPRHYVLGNHCIYSLTKPEF